MSLAAYSTERIREWAEGEEMEVREREKLGGELTQAMIALRAGRR